MGAPCRCPLRGILPKGLKREAVDRLFSSLKPNSYYPGNILFYQGNQPLCVYFLCKGRVKLVRTESSGRQRIVRLVFAPDIVGDRSLFAGQSYAATAEVLEDARICVAEAPRFLSLCAADPGLAAFFARRMARRAGESEEAAADLALRTLRERLAKHILELHDGNPKPGTRVSFPISRQDLASLLGAAPEAVSRTLTEMAGKRLIALEGRAMRVLDPARLRAMARVGRKSVDDYQAPLCDPSLWRERSFH